MAVHVQFEVAHRIAHRLEVAHLAGDVEDDVDAGERRRRPPARRCRRSAPPSRPGTFARSPPWVGTRASITTTSAPAAVNRWTTFEPMKPSPPVTRHRRPRKASAVRAGGQRSWSVQSRRRNGCGGSPRTGSGHPGVGTTTSRAKIMRAIAETTSSGDHRRASLPAEQVGERRSGSGRRGSRSGRARRGRARATGATPSTDDHHPRRRLPSEAQRVRHAVGQEQDMWTITKRWWSGSARNSGSVISIHPPLAVQNSRASPVVLLRDTASSRRGRPPMARRGSPVAAIRRRRGAPPPSRR